MNREIFRTCSTMKVKHRSEGAMTAPADDRRIMLIALAGASVLSFAPLLYIQSETTPITGAFFRMVYAIPILFILVLYLNREDRDPSKAGFSPLPLESF